MTFLNKLERLSLARLERVARDKRSYLLGKFTTYGRKKYYNIGPWTDCLTREVSVSKLCAPSD